jgi:hypothetical protein
VPGDPATIERRSPGARVEILRRLGIPPRERGSLDNGTCPDIFELTDGRFAIIGTDITDDLDPVLLADSGRASYERIVAIDRTTLIAAKADIPDA